MDKQYLSTFCTAVFKTTDAELKQFVCSLAANSAPVSDTYHCCSDADTHDVNYTLEGINPDSTLFRMCNEYPDVVSTWTFDVDFMRDYDAYEGDALVVYDSEGHAVINPDKPGAKTFRDIVRCIPYWWELDEEALAALFAVATSKEPSAEERKHLLVAQRFLHLSWHESVSTDIELPTDGIDLTRENAWLFIPPIVERLIARGIHEFDESKWMSTTDTIIE